MTLLFTTSLTFKFLLGEIISIFCDTNTNYKKKKNQTRKNKNTTITTAKDQDCQ